MSKVFKVKSMDEIFEEIRQERKRQDDLHGDHKGEQNHKPIVWMNILLEEVGEASQAANDGHFNDDDLTFYENYRKEIVQVAAVCINMLESFERNEKKKEFDFLVENWAGGNHGR